MTERAPAIWPSGSRRVHVVPVRGRRDGWRPERKTRKPRIYGVQTARVTGPLVVLVLTIAGIGASAVGLWRVRQQPKETEALTAEPAPA